MASVRAKPAASNDDAVLDLGAFVRDLAHDIANPLNAISMNAELARLLLDRDQTARAREAIGRLLEDCARCGRFIQGIQRFGSGLHAHAHEAISARTLVSSAMQLAAANVSADCQRCLSKAPMRCCRWIAPPWSACLPGCCTMQPRLAQMRSRFRYATLALQC